MKHDIDLYVNMHYRGFYPLEKIGPYFGEYYCKALEYARFIDWDEVILYAIFKYDEDSEALVSVDLMALRMDYSRYVSLTENLSPACRLYIVQND